MKSSGNYQLPPEFEGFVSNADSLLQQFQKIDVEDAITISIYPDQLKESVKYSLLEAVTLLDSITATIKEISAGYIWFKESINLFFIISKDVNDPICFRSTVKFSDSIEDEWFITYIAYKLTQAYANISISVTDTDGQFLLIEAADCIPEWLDPENCDNRIWIRQNKLHIISLQEAGRNIQNNGIKISAALEAIINRPRDTVASKEVQLAVEKRTVDIYPAKAYADTHIAHCTVSTTIAEALLSSPEVVSMAVNAFCLPPASGTNKNYIAAMQRFGSDLTDLITIAVRLTRLQYAKVMYQTFHIPKKFHTGQSKVAALGVIALNKAFELGCRLSCGLEAAYQTDKKDSLLNDKNRKNISSSNGSASGSKKKEFLDILKKRNFFEGVKQFSDEYVQLENTNLKIYDSNSYINDELYNDTDNNSSSSTNDFYIHNNSYRKNSNFYSDVDLFLGINNKSHRHNESESEIDFLLSNYNTCQSSLKEDSDAWMYLSPEELDVEMEKRVKSYQSNSGSIRGVNSVTNDTNNNNSSRSSNDEDSKNNKKIEEISTAIIKEMSPTNINKNEVKYENEKDCSSYQSEAEQLQEMLSSMKSFINLKSNLEGIDTFSEKSKSTKVEKNASGINRTANNDDDKKFNNNNGNGTKNGKNNCNNDKRDNNNSDSSNDYVSELSIDFEKMLLLLQPNNTTSTSTTTSTSEDQKSNTTKTPYTTTTTSDSSSVPLEAQRHGQGQGQVSGGKLEGPLEDYFYEKDLDELHSDDGSDGDDNSDSDSDGSYDSDDNIDIDSNNEKQRYISRNNNNDNDIINTNSNNNDNNQNNNDNNTIQKYTRNGNNSKITSSYQTVAVAGVGQYILTNSSADKNNKHDKNCRSTKNSNETVKVKASIGTSSHNSSQTSTTTPTFPLSNNHYKDENQSSGSDDSDDEIIRDKKNSHSINNKKVNELYDNNNNTHKHNNISSNNDNDDDDDDYNNDDDDDDDDSFYDDEVDVNSYDREEGGEGGDDDREEEEYFKEYQLKMDMELSASTLIGSFERTASTSHAQENTNDDSNIDIPTERNGDEDDEDTGTAYANNTATIDTDPVFLPGTVDVDLNFLKYLLESHASQLGGAGPATQLLSQLGIQLPHLPPMNTRENN